jgi:pimeloyl-ACP methyl ester carboxylesterase
MPTVTTSDGATLHYAVHDYTDRWRKADTIILIHGFARSGEFWFNIVPYLARFYRVICPDLRGLGQSLPLNDPATAISLAAYIGDIEAVADDAGAETFHLVGEAIGGAITLIFAAERPQRVRTLSVLAPAVWANEWIRKEYAVGYPSWVEAIRALGGLGTQVQHAGAVSRRFRSSLHGLVREGSRQGRRRSRRRHGQFCRRRQCNAVSRKDQGAGAGAVSDRQQYLLQRPGNGAARAHRFGTRDAPEHVLGNAGNAAARGLRRPDPELRRAQRRDRLPRMSFERFAFVFLSPGIPDDHDKTI